MKIFLTSQPYGEYMSFETAYPGMNPANGFAEALRAAWPKQAKVVLIASEPENYAMADAIAEGLKQHILGEGLSMESMSICDHRTDQQIALQLGTYDVIFLSGGHVPTTNAYYHEIALADRLTAFDGVLVGISSGTMNSALEVYAQPELPGESAPEFERFLEGLGLVGCSVVPHYQKIKNDTIDGKRLFEEVTFHDSYKRRFFLIPDGTYLTKTVTKEAFLEARNHRRVPKGEVVIHGEVSVLADGEITKLAEMGEVYSIRA